ncbi:MAG: helix-turn-helix transcriptional regulator [Eubacteriales bacterium]
MNLPISGVIRRLRRERDITQEELANALGVTYQSVSRWENDQAYPDKVNKQKNLEYGASGHTVCREAYRILTEPAGWEGFNMVRGEVRYLTQVERLIPYLNESKSE